MPNLVTKDEPKLRTAAAGTQVAVALAGNPNSGKTTIFNALTGSRQHVGNYPGVTVEKKEGSCRLGQTRLRVIDLPGTYSLTAYSTEELVARNVLINERPDVVIDILDAGNLERNLYLAVQVMELGSPMHTEDGPDGRVDYYKFVQGYHARVKAGRAVFHGVADFFTLGLWEIAGTPIEGIADGTEVKLEVHYDEHQRVRLVKALSGGEVIGSSQGGASQ